MNNITRIALAIVFLLYNFIKYVNSATEEIEGGDKKIVNRYPSFTLENVNGPYGIALWILLGCLAKIGELLLFFLCEELQDKLFIFSIS